MRGTPARCTITALQWTSPSRTTMALRCAIGTSAYALVCTTCGTRRTALQATHSSMAQTGGCHAVPAFSPHRSTRVACRRQRPHFRNDQVHTTASPPPPPPPPPPPMQPCLCALHHRAPPPATTPTPCRFYPTARFPTPELMTIAEGMVQACKDEVSACAYASPWMYMRCTSYVAAVVRTGPVGTCGSGVPLSPTPTPDLHRTRDRSESPSAPLLSHVLRCLRGCLSAFLQPPGALGACGCWLAAVCLLAAGSSGFKPGCRLTFCIFLLLPTCSWIQHAPTASHVNSWTSGNPSQWNCPAAVRPFVNELMGSDGMGGGTPFRYATFFNSGVGNPSDPKFWIKRNLGKVVSARRQSWLA